jgi:sugar-specific transcriptional regulator TrmB
MKNTQKVLEKWGLEPNEAAAYLGLLELGPSKVAEIAKVANIKRTTLYTVLENLENKGLVSRELKGLKTLFKSHHPKELLRLEEERKKDLESIFDGLAGLYHKGGSDEHIQLYKGTKNIQKIYLDLLDEVRLNEKYMVITDQESWFQSDPLFYQKFADKRARKVREVRMLMQNSETARHFKKFEKNFNLDIKILPEEVSLLTNLVITERKVLIHELTKPSKLLLIENRSIITMHQQIFELLWKSLQ